MITSLVENYFLEIDRSVETLSNKYEQYIVGLPSYFLCNRRITIGYVAASDVIIVKAIPDSSLPNDFIEEKMLVTNEDIANIVHPFLPRFNAERNLTEVDLVLGDLHMEFGSTPLEIRSLMMGGLTLIEKGNINATPVFEFHGLLAICAKENLIKEFSCDSARKVSLSFWNNGINGLPLYDSFVASLQTIFDKFSLIIKRKSFLERRIHRYINSYPKYLLPCHKVSYFEHPIYFGDIKRVADFILEREIGFPALLIELENPNAKMFKLNGEFTAEANHARSQISEWVRFIEQNPNNAKGDMSFLHGPKQRLVVMGRGMGNLREMENSKYTDTIMWTYDMLLQQAKDKWNNMILEQCSLLRISNPNVVK